MTPSIDVSLPTAPTSVRQTTPASASAPVAFQDCLDGVPPADVALSPSAKGNPDDTSTDEPRKTARPVDDPAALAALAAVSVPTPRTTVDGATALLGRGAAASVAGQTTDVADGSALPQPATALAAVTATTVAAGQVTPALAPSDADAAVGTAAGDSTGALTAATSTSPVASPTAPLAADPGSSGAAVLDLAAPGTGATPAVGASAIEPANSTPTPVGESTQDQVPGGRPIDQLGAATTAPAAPVSAPSSVGPVRPTSSPSASSTSPADTPASAGAPTSASGTGAARRGAAEASKVDGTASSPTPTVVGHEPSRSSTASSTPADSSGPATAALPHAQTVPDRATHTGPMHLDVDLGGEGLGPLRLRATSVAGQLHVSMTATDARVRSALLDRSPDLKRDMRSAGLDLASFDVNGSTHGRASEGDQSGRPPERRSDEASRASAPDMDPAAGVPLRRVSGQASPTRLDLLL